MLSHRKTVEINKNIFYENRMDVERNVELDKD